MTEEEKNAIDELKASREYFEYQPEGCNWKLSFDEFEVHTIIDVILNLIQKQDTEINSLKETIQKQAKSREHLKKQLKGEIAVKDTEIKKLNNAIDKLVERIKYDTEWFYSELDNKSEEEIKEYFMKEDK